MGVVADAMGLEINIIMIAIALLYVYLRYLTMRYQREAYGAGYKTPVRASASNLKYTALCGFVSSSARANL